MKTFSELKPGDRLYEHIGSQIINNTVIKITEEKNTVQHARRTNVTPHEAELGFLNNGTEFLFAV